MARPAATHRLRLRELRPVRLDIDALELPLAKIQAVTAEDVKAALNKYIAGKKKVLLEYLPESMKPKEVSPTDNK